MDIYRLFGINMVLDGSALLIVTALTVICIRAGKRHGDRTENRLFFSMCVMSLCLTVSDIAKFVYNIFFLETVGWRIRESLIFFSDPVIGILSMMIVVQWLLLVEYTLHRSKDLIRRRYPAALIPFFAAVVLEILTAVPLILGFGDNNSEFLHLGRNIHFRSALIILFYTLLTYVAVHREKNGNGFRGILRLHPWQSRFCWGPSWISC